MRHDAAMWIAVAISLLGGCEESPQHKTTDTQPDNVHWQQDGPLPNGKINAGSTVTMDTAATPPVEVLSPATSGNSLHRPLHSAVAAGDQVRGQVTLSSDTPLHIRIYVARNDKAPWEASQREITIGPSPTTHTISHTFKSPHQDARLQIALLSNADTLMIHDASVQFVTPSCDWHVIAVSTLPDPQTADYPDCLDVMHLQRPDSCDEPHEALVALRTMTDRTLTTAANIKLGDLLAIDTLTPWSETPESIRSIRTVQDMDEFHLPMFSGDGPKVVGQRAPSASAVTQRAVEVNADGTLTPAPSQGQTQWIADDLAAINQIAADHGGWQKWADSLDGFRGGLRCMVSDEFTLIGDDWIAKLGGIQWLQSSVMCRQPNDEVIYPKATEAIIDTAAKLNARGIDLIVIPVPPRAEVMPEKFGGEPTELVAPQRYRFMKQLLSSGVEVVDVLPAMLDAKADATAEDPVVFADNSHWASRGLYAAAATLAPRISRYQQADQSLVIPPLTVGTTPASRKMLRLTTDKFRAAWPIREVQFRSVKPNTHGGPGVLFISDSYGTVHIRERGDFSRHLSAMSGVPIDRLSEAGSGPKGPRILARNNGKALTDRPAVIWLFVAKALYHPSWRPALPAYRPHWQQDGPLPKGKINAGSTATMDTAATPPVEVLSPAPSQGQTQWIADDLAAINQIAADHGGWQKWADSLDGFRGDLRRMVPDKITVIGDDWLASKGRAYWLLDSVMCRQPNDEVIYPKATETIIDTAAKLNARGIDLIVIPIPPRAEVMPEKFGGEPTELVAPQRYRFMKQLLSSGVEVVDVLPAMLDAKADATAEDPVVFAANSHWASRGLYAAAATLAPRISRYQQADQSLVIPPLTVGTTPATPRLLRETTDDFRAAWPIREVQFRSVEPNTHGGPAVLLITDSYGKTHNREKGDFSRHLSAMSGVPIERLSEDGSGPRAPAILARDGRVLLENRQVVVLMFVARHLPDRNGWRPVLSQVIGERHSTDESQQ